MLSITIQKITILLANEMNFFCTRALMYSSTNQVKQAIIAVKFLLLLSYSTLAMSIIPSIQTIKKSKKVNTVLRLNTKVVKTLS